MTYRHEPLDAERRARQEVEGVAQRAVGMWRNVVDHDPELAGLVRERAPRLAGRPGDAEGREPLVGQWGQPIWVRRSHRARRTSAEARSGR